MTPNTPAARREWLAVLAFTLLGAVVRFWDAGRLGILHFDEGIYALAGLWVRSTRGLASLDPSVAFYAPPVFPTLVGVSYLLLGVSDTAAVLVSLVAGVLTIPVAAWVAGRAFGRGAAAAAAALVALCGQHVAFSRMALTDATFLLLFLVALGLGMRFLERPGVLRALLFGLAVGLAQLTKYNGFLAGVSVAFAAVRGLIDRDPERRRLAWLALGYGALAAAVALLCYLPWFHFVQTRTPGGYAALIAHHRGYLDPPRDWIRNAHLQWAQAVVLSGRLAQDLSWGAAGWFFAWLGSGVACGCLGRSLFARARQWSANRVLLLAGVALFGFLPDASLWLAIVSVPWLVLDPRRAQRVLGLGWLLMAALTPLYHPYSRLALPGLGLSLIVAAGWVASRFEALAWRPDGPRWPSARVAWATGLFILVVVAAVRFPDRKAGVVPAPGLLGPSDGLRWLAELRNDWLTQPPYAMPRTVYVFARPSLLFYLGMNPGLSVRRVADLPTLEAIDSPGDWRMSDGCVLDAQYERLPFTHGAGGRPLERPLDAGNLPVLLDLDPASSLRPAHEWILLDEFRRATGYSPGGARFQGLLYLAR